MASGQLLPRNPATRAPVLGGVTVPLFHPTTAVSPSWYPSAWGITTLTVVPRVSSVASCAVEPYTPLKAIARMPDVPAGSSMRAEAASSGTSHSSPVTFQYSSSWSSKNRSPLRAR